MNPSTKKENADFLIRNGVESEQTLLQAVESLDIGRFAISLLIVLNIAASIGLVCLIKKPDLLM